MLRELNQHIMAENFDVQISNWRTNVFEWREKERLRIIENLEESLGNEIEIIDKKISDEFENLTSGSKIRLSLGFEVAAKKFHDENVAPMVNDWLNRTYEKLCQQIPESKTTGRIEGFGGPDRFKKNWNAMLETGAGAALGIGAFTALPMGLSAAVTTTTTLFVFTTTVVSLPVLFAAVGGAALAGAFGFGKIENGLTKENLTEEYRKEVLGALTLKVLGTENLYMAPVKKIEPDSETAQLSLAQVLFCEIDYVALKQLEAHPWSHQ